MAHNSQQLSIAGVPDDDGLDPNCAEIECAF